MKWNYCNYIGVLIKWYIFFLFKNVFLNDFFNVNEEYFIRVILINSKFFLVVDVKLLVYEKYKYVINRWKIFL